jgi:heterodisulfide reductase subunit A
MKNKKIGVYVCHCGSNISDVVDIEKTLEILAKTEEIHILKSTMFACSDSAQKEIVEDIREKGLEGLVVASCSPKLHVPTFRNVAKRAGLNPYQYAQVNIREQSSWAHSDQPGLATEKAIQLIRAGIAKVRYSRALDPIWIDADNSVAVIGAGITGLRTALGLGRLGTKVYLLEKEHRTGGKITEWGKLTGYEKTGKDLAEHVYRSVSEMDNVEIMTGAEVDSVNGSVGDFSLNVNLIPDLPPTDKKSSEQKPENRQIKTGAVILATGFDNYQPGHGEFGYGNHPAIITLDELKTYLARNGSIAHWEGQPVRQIAFIYCVGSCQAEGENKYCSRICCTLALDTSLQISKTDAGIHCIHLYRQIRTYGKQELIYEEACRKGDLFLKFDDEDPPEVEVENGSLSIRIRDQLTMGREMEIRPDLIILVNGMVPSAGYEKTAEMFKAPLGRDRFFNEVHPKLRPVETVIDGVFIAGTCQGPKNIAESVKSGMSAVAKSNALLRNEKIELDPTIAFIDPAKCTWCDLCKEICPFDAISQEQHDGKQVAAVISSSCKGCGMCTPVCPSDAIDLIGYTNAEIEGMIESMIIND